MFKGMLGKSIMKGTVEEAEIFRVFSKVFFVLFCFVLFVFVCFCFVVWEGSFYSLISPSSLTLLPSLNTTTDIIGFIRRLSQRKTHRHQGRYCGGVIYACKIVCEI